jgi:endoglucanase
MAFFLTGCMAWQESGESADGTVTETEFSGSREGKNTGETAPTETDRAEAEPTETDLTATAAQTTEADSIETDRMGESEVEEGKANCPSTCGALQVIGTQLCDENGNPVQLRGLSTHGIAWYPDYINEELFRQFHDEWNVNVIRLAMYTEEYGGYCAGGNQEQLKALIDAGVQYATDNDMYVIIDWHILSDGDPNQHKDEAIAFFNEMTAKYADHTNVLYEICNEPNGGTSWSSIKSYANEVIPVIRANDPDAIILVGTPNWSQYVNEAAADPLTGYDNIMYTLHFYAATHKEDLRNTMTAAVEAGLPVFVSEYGICDASGSGAIDEEQANLWVDTLNDYGISYVAWNISNKAETSAIFKSSCTKTSGITGEDLSESGNWLYEMLTEK